MENLRFPADFLQIQKIRAPSLISHYKPKGIQNIFVYLRTYTDIKTHNINKPIKYEMSRLRTRQYPRLL